MRCGYMSSYLFFFQAEDGIRDVAVTGVQTCALPISFALPIVWRRGLVAGDLLRQRLDFASRPRHGPATRAGGAIRDRSQPLENRTATPNGSLGAFSGGGPWRHRAGLSFALRARKLAARIFLSARSGHPDESAGAGVQRSCRHRHRRARGNLARLPVLAT